MRSSTSSKSNKPQPKHREAADTAEAVVEIAVIVVAVGDKVVVVGEEEAVARLRRELERGNLYAFTKTIINNITIPRFFYCLRRWVRDLFSVLDGEVVIGPSSAGRWQICQFPRPFACMRRSRCCCGRDFKSGPVFG
jgi:hypothetical protein